MQAAVVMFGAHCRSRFAGLDLGYQYLELSRRIMCACWVLFWLHAPGRGITADKMDPVLVLLKPVQDDNGRWTFNTALTALLLDSAGQPPPIHIIPKDDPCV